MTAPCKIDSGRLSRITGWMEKQVVGGRLAGLALQVAHKGEVVFSQHHGLRDIEAGLSVEKDTIWRIYSMSKPITAFAALMLYEEGAYQLDQPVADFLPGFGGAGVWVGGDAPIGKVEPLARPVTMHDLMTHQAGLVYPDAKGTAVERAWLDAGLTLGTPEESIAAAVGRMMALPLQFQPGTDWNYSQSQDVLGRVIEVISGQPLGQFLQERIFGPLGMTDTAFGLRPDQMGRLAALYGPGLTRLAAADDPRRRAPVRMENGGAGLLSTMGDYQRFATMLLQGGQHEGQVLLGRKAMALMTSDQIFAAKARASYDRFMGSGGYGYGFGISVLHDPARAMVTGSRGNFGWGGLASTNFWVDPAEEMTVILMTQLLPSSTYPIWRELRIQAYQALI